MARTGQQSGRGSRRNRSGPLGRFGLLLNKVSSRPPFRLILFGLLSTCWFAVVLVCLWDYQVLQAEHFNKKAKKQHEGTIEIRAARGVIYDRLGEKLAFSTPARVDRSVSRSSAESGANRVTPLGSTRHRRTRHSRQANPRPIPVGQASGPSPERPKEFATSTLPGSISRRRTSAITLTEPWRPICWARWASIMPGRRD